MPYTILGLPNDNLSAFDTQMVSFLGSTSIPNASLTVRHGGTQKLSHIYSADGSAYVPTPGKTMYRLGLLTQPLVAAGVRNLAGRPSPALTLGTLAASHLKGLPYDALPDSYAFADHRWTSITLGNLLNQNAGFDSSLDNFFDARGVAQRAGLSEPPNKAQNVADVAGKQLKYAPGTALTSWFQHLSIMSYTALGLAVEAITLQPVLEVVRAQLAQGAQGVANSGLAAYTPSIQRAHTGWPTPNESPPDSAGQTGSTVFDPRTSQVTQIPVALGGGDFFLEGHDSGAGLLATTDALAAFIDFYAHDGNWLPVPRSNYSFAWSSGFAGHFVYAFWWADGKTSIAVAFNQLTANQDTKVNNLVTAAMGAVTNWS